MRLARMSQVSLLCLVVSALCGLSTGCGSGTPADGTQVNIGIPKVKAEQQNKAFQEYSKQRAKSGQAPKR